MASNDICPVCGCNPIQIHSDWDKHNKTIHCECCGSFIIEFFARSYYLDDFKNIDKNKLSAFLFHSCKLKQTSNNKRFFYYIGDSEHFKKIKEEYPDAQLLILDEVEAWYPKNFSEKVDTILLGLAQLSKFDGGKITLSDEQKNSLFFVKRFNENSEHYSKDDQFRQYYFYFSYMYKQKFLFEGSKSNALEISLFLEPKGVQRIDELQKNQINSKKVFVAMGYSDKNGQPRTDEREAIRKAINKAGFETDFLDEHEHNNQIVPEMLYRIRQSRFVIADLTYCNNGAYYEAGYAAGLGKEVIHMCNNTDFHNDGHFDVKQKSTILWETVEDIEDKLFKRIQATIS